MAPNTSPIWVRSAPSLPHARPGLTLPWTLATPVCPRPPHHFCRITRSPSFLLPKGLPVTPLQDSPQPLPARQSRGLQDVTASPPSLQSGCVWLMGPMGVRAAWRCGTAGAGAPCAMTAGTCGTPPWPAGSWAVGARWPPPGAPSSGRVQGPSFWMTSAVGGTRRLCGSVRRGPGVSTTVTTGRTLGPCVTVRAAPGRGQGGRPGGLCPEGQELGCYVFPKLTPPGVRTPSVQVARHAVHAHM